jgi:hypothetical protein
MTPVTIPGSEGFSFCRGYQTIPHNVHPKLAGFPQCYRLSAIADLSAADFPIVTSLV